MQGYADIHTHVLPFVDDGARDLETAVGIVKECINQGITTIVCTPHYFSSKGETVEKFLKKREKSYRLLKAELDKQGITQIDIRLGAEVSFDCDLSKIENIEKLSIEGTSYILIEMPRGTWQDGMFDCLYTLIAKKNLVPIIAHIERYYQSEREFQQLEKLDVCFQVNASSFLDSVDKKNADKLLKNKKIHLIATDTHNMKNRTVRIQQGFSYITKKASPQYADYLRKNAYCVVNNEEIEKNVTYAGEFYGYQKMTLLEKLFRRK